MDNGKKFHIIDVFAEKPFCGNQLVVIEHSDDLSDTVKQKIAAEMNYSETVFINNFNNEAHSAEISIFTPKQQIPFAGHPCLGAAWVLKKKGFPLEGDHLYLQTRAGEICMYFSQDESSDTVIWMQQPDAVFGAQYLIPDTAAALGLEVDDFDENYPLQWVSAGLPHMIIPLKTKDALQRASVQADAWVELFHDSEPCNLLIFTPQPFEENQNLAVRVFAPQLGIREDSATGSGNGCLAAWLLKHRYFDSGDISVIAGQGYLMNRPSQLYLQGRIEDNQMQVFVGGKISPMASGIFQIPDLLH